MMYNTPTQGTSGRHNDGGNAMNYITEAERLKRYYQGLEDAPMAGMSREVYDDIEASINDPDAGEEYRVPMSLWLHVLMPLGNTFAYIVNNRLIHESMTELLEQVPANMVMLTPDEIHAKLRLLNADTVGEFLRTVACSVGQFDALLAASREDDSDRFAQALAGCDSDLRAISHLCNQLEDYATPTLAPDGEDGHLILDVITGLNMANINEDNEGMMQSLAQLNEDSARLADDDSDENLDRFLKSYRNFLWRHYVMILIEYFDHYDTLKPRERELIEHYATLPEAREVYDICYRNYVVGVAAKDDGPDAEAPSTDTPLRPADMEHADEFFNCSVEVLSAGAAPLLRLLDYLSDRGYIDGSPGARRLLFYRLTGRCRPDEVAPLCWHSAGHRPYELIYLVKHLAERGDYGKMRRFFTGPRWPKDRDSSYAKSSCYDFRAFLHQLYPSRCPL